MPDLFHLLPAFPWEGLPLPRYILTGRTPPLFVPAISPKTLSPLPPAPRSGFPAFVVPTENLAAWRSQYPPGLVDKAVRWAQSWTEGMLQSPLYAPLREIEPQVLERVAPVLFRQAILLAENWLRAMGR